MLTVEQIAVALQKKAGNITEAAKALKVTRQALHKRINDDELLKSTLIDAREALVDMAESEARKQIRKGNTAIIIFTLKTLGKERGYVEQHDLKHSGSVDLIVKGYVTVTPDDWDESTTDSSL
jgi:predicted transcriptional regulator